MGPKQPLAHHIWYQDEATICSRVSPTSNKDDVRDAKAIATVVNSFFFYPAVFLNEGKDVGECVSFTL